MRGLAVGTKRPIYLKAITTHICAWQGKQSRRRQLKPSNRPKIHPQGDDRPAQKPTATHTVGGRTFDVRRPKQQSDTHGQLRRGMSVDIRSPKAPVQNKRHGRRPRPCCAPCSNGGPSREASSQAPGRAGSVHSNSRGARMPYLGHDLPHVLHHLCLRFGSASEASVHDMTLV